mmetsp:Transcript_16965/g.53883  ORF Transcript_16965/g.53883 Transcript_16965/m.53883 type:complete len:147 (+) Transcript_16965:315-755(+)
MADKEWRTKEKLKYRLAEKSGFDDGDGAGSARTSDTGGDDTGTYRSRGSAGRSAITSGRTGDDGGGSTHDDGNQSSRSRGSDRSGGSYGSRSRADTQGGGYTTTYAESDGGYTERSGQSGVSGTRSQRSQSRASRGPRRSGDMLSP